MYAPLQSSRLYEQVVEQINQLIQTGQLKPGDQLPSERELGEQFNVSRTVIREAVKALREKGLVEIKPGKGTYITDDTSDVMRESINMMVKLDQDAGLPNLMQVREILEPEIAKIAAIKATQNEIQQMQAAIHIMDESLNDAEAYIEADHAFHRALAQATQNKLIVRLLDSVVDVLTEQRRQIFITEKKGPIRGQQHHKKILHAIKHQDGKAALLAMIDHLKQVRDDSGIRKEVDD